MLIPVILTYSNIGELVHASTGLSSLPILLRDAPKAKIYDEDSHLQRVRINTFFLSMELSTITGISMKLPIL